MMCPVNRQGAGGRNLREPAMTTTTKTAQQIAAEAAIKIATNRVVALMLAKADKAAILAAAAELARLQASTAK